MEKPFPGGEQRRGGKASRVLGVEKHAVEEASGHRFLAWVVRHPDWPCGRDRQPVEETGGYCWSTPLKVLEVLFFSEKFVQLFAFKEGMLGTPISVLGG